MSGWFDGLMRSSGLPLGDAPVIGAPARRAPLALEETAAETPAPSFETRPAGFALSTPPAARETASTRTIGDAAAPTREGARESEEAPDAAPTLAAAAARRPETIAPAPPDAPPRAAASQGDRPPPGEAPALSSQRVLESVMRWVAGAPAEPTANEDAPAPSSAPRAPRVAAAAPETFAPVRAGPRVAETPPEEPTAPAPQAAPAAEARAVPALAPGEPARPQRAAEDGFELSIGSIRVEVEAPAPPSLRVAERAPPPAPRAAPRSGLGRRSLRGF